jgi:hypothetical protein
MGLGLSAAFTRLFKHWRHHTQIFLKSNRKGLANPKNIMYTHLTAMP